MAEDQSATLYRMVLPDHTCPFGVRAKQLLEQRGFEVEDRVLGSRADVDAFKAEQNIQTTPLVFHFRSWRINRAGCRAFPAHKEGPGAKRVAAGARVTAVEPGSLRGA